uniref:Uncharacterized protein n=1 Tax=Magnetococcus massalia (strain MO-1) TaxID=451514 RepID=A0A1S7LK99_MAGMO|nr:protein of unknown function [Candidatus Magnetococcus massalia]
MSPGPNLEMIQLIGEVLRKDEYQPLTDAQVEAITQQVTTRLGRMKWVDEHVIATDLMLLRIEQPSLFSG